MHYSVLIQRAFARIGLCLLTAGLLIGSFFSLHAVSSAPNALLVVNTTADNLTPGDGFCTLREAISTTNGHTTDCGTNSESLPIITFDTTLTQPIQLTLTGSEDDNASGDLDIMASVIISGNGTDTTIIDGNGNNRLFEIISGSVTIANLTLQNGETTGNDELHGGAIHHPNPTAILTATNVIIQNNQATRSSSAYGGGIYAIGDLWVISSTITTNYAGGHGGGLYQHTGRLTVITSNILSNYSAIISTTGAGGGIFIDESCAGFSISSTTLANNRAHRGGGLYSLCQTDSTMTNTTISLNSANRGTESTLNRNGGGLIYDANGGTLALKFVTVYSNVVATANFSQTGSGIAAITGVIEIQNSVVVSNYVSNNSDDTSCYSVGLNGLVSNGYNFLGQEAACSAAGTDQVGVAVLLRPLADNGGGTLTHAPAYNSPLIDFIPADKCNNAIITDQRGRPRPDTASGRCDVGAYEVAPEPEIELLSNGRVINNGDNTPSILDGTIFDTITFGDPAAVQTFTIRNIGISLLTLANTPAITFAQGTIFSLGTSPSSTAIISGGQTTFAINMNSTAAGTFTDTVYIQSNDEDKNPFTFVIVGTVDKANTVTQITSHTPNPSAVNYEYTVSVEVSSTAGTPTGFVDVTNGDGNGCQIDLSEGTSCELTSTSGGETLLTATYLGDDNFNTSTDTTTHFIKSHDLGLSMHVSADRETNPIFIIFETTLFNTREVDTVSATITHKLPGDLKISSATIFTGSQPYTGTTNYTYTKLANGTIVGTWAVENLPSKASLRLELIVYRDTLGAYTYENNSEIVAASPADEYADNNEVGASIRIFGGPLHVYLPLAISPPN